ncbi:MAG: SUF system NifU family Fe-S cluster assembly protein [Propionibacteriaceae bacterium]|jgi:nitrogen fixation NifU-like protein|nr:SUF system NifU family Fe-S cluster assembly protein [Propionibacteriaceae bacterium]
MPDLSSLYQDIILDHYREKHHSGLREPYTVEVTHVNPSCGDELVLRLATNGSDVVDVSYESVGCSISQASTSVMTDLVITHDLAHALELHDGFKQMIEGQGKVELDEEVYEDAIAFSGVAQFPARVKCAMLGWSALRDAILRVQGNVDE